MADLLYVTIQRAMALAGVSRRTIYNWLEAGKLTTIRTAGGRVRIHAPSLFREDQRWSTRPLMAQVEDALAAVRRA